MIAQVSAKPSGFLVLALALLALASCKWTRSGGETGEEEAPSRALFDCTCEYLTDTDLTGQERVRVCAESEDEARKRGRGCAQTHSPGSVSNCACTHWATVDCPQNDCRLNR